MSLIDGKCTGPYERTCIEYSDDRANIRLYQWCPACLHTLSERLNHQPFTVNPPRVVDIYDFSELARRWRGPLTLEDLSEKYYGTHVLNVDGDEVIEFWSATGEPSEREKRRFGNWTPERWAKHCSDSHWECEADFRAALEFIALAEAIARGHT